MSHGRSTTIAPPAQPTQFLSANTLARAMAPSRPRSGDLAPVKFDTVDDVPCQRFSLFSCDQNHKPASQRATCASQSRIIHGVTRDKRAGGVEPFFCVYGTKASHSRTLCTSHVFDAHFENTCAIVLHRRGMARVGGGNGCVSASMSHLVVDLAVRTAH